MIHRWHGERERERRGGREGGREGVREKGREGEGKRETWIMQAEARRSVQHPRIYRRIRASVDALCRDGEGQISRERVQRGRLTRQGTTS